jgi:hypothetical protein
MGAVGQWLGHGAGNGDIEDRVFLEGDEGEGDEGPEGGPAELIQGLMRMT